MTTLSTTQKERIERIAEEFVLRYYRTRSVRNARRKQIEELLTAFAEEEQREGEWQPIETMDKSKMQYVLVYGDEAMRSLLWNPRGYWENPCPAGTISRDIEPTHWMELPPAPTF